MYRSVGSLLRFFGVGWKHALVLSVVLLSVAMVYAEPVTIRWATWGPAPIDQQLIEAFEREHPNIHIEYIGTAGTPQHHQKMKVLAAAGVGADVLAVDGVYLLEFITAGILQPIDHLLEKAPFSMKDYFPASLPDVQYRGKTYGLPYCSSPHYMLYNVNHLNEAGLPRPDVHWSQQTFLEYLRKLTRKEGGQTLRWGSTRLLQHTAHVIFPWVWSAGGQVVDTTSRRFLMTEPEAVGIMDWLLQLEQQGFTGSGNFGNQTASITIQYPGGFPTVTGQEWPFEWDVTIIPGGPGGQYAVWKANAMGISSTTKHLEEAWTFLQFLLAPKSPGYRIYVQNKRFPPQTQSAELWGLFNKPGTDPKSLIDVTMLLASKHGRALPKLLQFDEIIVNTIGSALNKIRNGQVSARGGMEEIRPIVERLLQNEP